MLSIYIMLRQVYLFYREATKLEWAEQTAHDPIYSILIKFRIFFSSLLVIIFPSS